MSADGTGGWSYYGPHNEDPSKGVDYCPARNITLEGFDIVNAPANAIMAAHTSNLRVDRVNVARTGSSGLSILNSFNATVVGTEIVEAQWLVAQRSNLLIADFTVGYVVDDVVVIDSPTVCQRGDNLQDYYFFGYDSYIEVAACCPDTGTTECYPDPGDFYSYWVDPSVGGVPTALGIASTTARNGLIIASEVGNMGHGSGIYVNAGLGFNYPEEAGALDIDVVQNITHHNSGAGIHIASEGTETSRPCSSIRDIVVMNNFSFSEKVPFALNGAYSTADCLDYDDGSGETHLPELEGIVVANNTLHGCSDSSTSDDDLHVFNGSDSCARTTSFSGGSNPALTINTTWADMESAGGKTLTMFNNLATNTSSVTNDWSGSTPAWLACEKNFGFLDGSSTGATSCGWLFSTVPWEGTAPGHDVSSEVELAISSTAEAVDTGFVEDTGIPAYAPHLDGLDGELRDTPDVGADEAD